MYRVATCALKRRRTHPHRSSVLNVGDPLTILYTCSAEDFKHGWFATGDIGRWVDGRLYIVDRKKNLVKLSSGEYIAYVFVPVHLISLCLRMLTSLEKLETLYKESSLVENLMIHANTEENVLIAVVQPSRKALTSAAVRQTDSNIAKPSLTTPT